MTQLPCHPGVVISANGYPYSEPLVYSAPYMSVSQGPEPAFVGKADNLCGNMMTVGGMAKMKVALAVIVSCEKGVPPLLLCVISCWRYRTSGGIILLCRGACG